MKKQLLAGLLSVSVALFGVSATPAMADRNDDLAKVILGIAAVAIIGSAIQNNRGGAQPAPVPNPHTIPARARVLPSACLQDVRTRDGSTVILGVECLSRSYRYAHLLPESCEVDLRTRRREWVTGFDPRCLRREGFRLDYDY